MKDKSRLALIFGILCCFIFASFPYLLDLISPSKSAAQKIGENVLEIIDTIKGTDAVDFKDRKRNITSNVLIIIGFVFFFITIYFSVITQRTKENRWVILGSVILSILGLAFFILYLGISLISSLIISVLILILVLFILAGVS